MNTKNELGAIEDRLISLNGHTASRERAESRLKHLSDKRDTSGLTADEIAELDAITAELQKVAGDECDALAKSLNESFSNFLRRRKRRPELTMAKSLRSQHRLVLPKKVRG